MELQTVFAFATLLAHIAIALCACVYFFSRKKRATIKKYFADFGYILSFFVALSSILGSLYFSNIVGWEPCSLCWYQRIAMYPLVVIFALGVWRQDTSARVYGTVLASIGLLFSLYQIYIQVASTLGDAFSVFCANFGTVDCATVYMLEFGYITFPVMSATAFSIILLLQIRGKASVLL